MIPKTLTHPLDEGGCGFIDPWQFPQGRATWPDVQSPEHRYMKLATKKKILRIRHTIYEDSGNPFADDIDSEGVSPCSEPSEYKPLSPSPSILEEPSSGTAPSGVDVYQGGLKTYGPLTTKNSLADPKVVRLPTPRHQGMPSAIQTHRRSQSVEVSLPTPLDDYNDYIATRTLWQNGSAQIAQLIQNEQSVKKIIRDTKFYGFYDNILQEYKRRESQLKDMPPQSQPYFDQIVMNIELKTSQEAVLPLKPTFATQICAG